MTPGDARALLARLVAVETETREAMRAVRFALDDMGTAHESARQLRAELAAVLGVEDVPRNASDPMPSPEEYARIILGDDSCGRVRR